MLGRTLSPAANLAWGVAQPLQVQRKEHGEMAALTKELKQELAAKFGKNPQDTGSTEVQVALLTARIQHLIEHFRTHKKDHSGRRGLLRLVGQRRNLLTYLRKNDLERYRALIKELGLRK
jgi:small subunit ribosomal protein S15